MAKEKPWRVNKQGNTVLSSINQRPKQFANVRWLCCTTVDISLGYSFRKEVGFSGEDMALSCNFRQAECTWRCHIANYSTAREARKRHTTRSCYPRQTRGTQRGENLLCTHWVISLRQTCLNECSERSHKTTPNGCNWTRKTMPRVARHAQTTRLTAGQVNKHWWNKQPGSL